MIGWTELTPDIIISDIRKLFEQLSVNNVLKILKRSIEEPTIIIDNKCYQKVLEYLKNNKKELGGLLIGRSFSLPFITSHCYNYLTIITDSVESEEFENSGVHLEMSSEIWNRARYLLNEGKIVVGWYHSHPNLGAFFSGTDRATQKAFFNQTYSLGIVIDNIRDEIKIFHGSESNLINSKLIIS